MRVIFSLLVGLGGGLLLYLVMVVLLFAFDVGEGLIFLGGVVCAPLMALIGGLVVAVFAYQRW